MIYHPVNVIYHPGKCIVLPIPGYSFPVKLQISALSAVIRRYGFYSPNTNVVPLIGCSCPTTKDVTPA